MRLVSLITSIILYSTISYAQVDPELLSHIHKFGEADYEQDMANIFSYKSGARVVASSTWSRESPWPAFNTLNDSLGKSGVWIASLKHRPNHWIVIELPELTYVSTLCFNTEVFASGKAKGVAPYSIKVEFSTTAPDKDYSTVLNDILTRNKNEQYFNIEYQQAKWVKITIDQNYGNTAYMGLGRVYAYNDVEFNSYEQQLLTNKKLDVYIHFHQNSALVNAESIPIIEEIAKVLYDNPKIKIRVEGHTDPTGEDHYNIKLSKERAHSVVELLVSMGIERDRLRYVGKGDTELLTHFKDEKNIHLNRRVSFVLF